jgi:hypothetical protein
MHPALIMLLDKLPGLVLSLAGLGVPFVVERFIRTVKSERDLHRIRASVKGLYLVRAAVADKTSTTLDDKVLEILRRLEEELGRPLKPAEQARARNMVLAMQADPSEPNIAPDSSTLARALHLPLPGQHPRTRA